MESGWCTTWEGESGGTRGHERGRTIEGRKEGMNEVGQRRKSGMKPLSASKTWPWQQIGMCSCSSHFVFALTHTRWQTFVIRRSRSNGAQRTRSSILRVGFQPASYNLKLQPSPPMLLLEHISWHLVIGSTRALDLGSLPPRCYPTPRPHPSDSDSGHAKPHPQCSSFKFELAQVRSSDVPFICRGLTVF